MKLLLKIITTAIALFVTASPQLVDAQRTIARPSSGIRGLVSNSDEVKDKIEKIMNTIANLHPEGEGSDIVERVLNNEKTMESIAKLKNALDHNFNEHGRHLAAESVVMQGQVLVVIWFVILLLLIFS